MKLVEAKAVKEMAQAILPDPILRLAVNAAVDATAATELVTCGECSCFQGTESCRRDNGYGKCLNPEGMGGVVFGNSFCSNGKKRRSE